MTVLSRLDRRVRRAAPVCVVVGLLGCGGGGGDGGPLFPGVTVGSVDVTADAQAAADSVLFCDEVFLPGYCAVQEGDVPAGTRRLLRFDMVVVNFGDQDLVLGSPNNPEPPLVPGDFSFAGCHQHYHFDGWADFTLMDLSLTTTVATGHKQAFCLLDSIPYSSIPPSGYHCNYQGLTKGWGDLYDRCLDGQWVDVTGVPEGDYMLVLSVNAAGKVVEVIDAHPDTITVQVHVPDPAVALPASGCPLN